MSDIDMLGRATAAVGQWVLDRDGVYIDTRESERCARAVLEAAGVLGADAQPPPVHQDGEPSMHDRAIEWLVEVHPGAASVAVCALLDARKAFGLAKYGTVLQISGPRDPAADCADELADALVYAQQGVERALARDVHPGIVVWWMRRRDEIGSTLLALMAGLNT